MVRLLAVPLIALAGAVGYIATAKSAPIAITGVTVSPARFSVASGGTTAATHGTTIRFRQSRRSTVRLVISRRVSGRRVGRKCEQATSRLRRRPACSRYVASTTIVRTESAGNAVIAFSGRVGRRALPTGRYRLAIRAITAPRRGHRTKNLSAARFASFTIVAAPKAANPGGTTSPQPTAPGPAPTPSSAWPYYGNTGVPAGWTPTTTTSNDVHVTTPGAVLQNVELTGGANIYIDAPNVTVKDDDLQGGSVRNCDNWFNGSAAAPCEPGLLVEDTTVELAAGQTWDSGSGGVGCQPAIWLGDFTAVRVKVWRRCAGFYAGDKSGGSGPIEVDDSYVNLTNGPDNTGSDPFHSEALQCYDGPAVTLNDDTFDTTDASHGTSSFFCPAGQGNTGATVNGLLAMNGSNDPTSDNFQCCGFVFRDGMPGSVTNLHIVDNTWGPGPIAVTCPVIKQWGGDIVDIDRFSGGTSTAPYNVTKVVRRQACNTNDS